MHLASAAAYAAVAVGGWKSGGKSGNGGGIGPAVQKRQQTIGESSLARPTENSKASHKETTIIQLQVDGRALAEATISGANNLQEDRRDVKISEGMLDKKSRRRLVA